MNQSARKRITDWFQTRPRILAYLEGLNKQKVEWVIYAGTSVKLLTDTREPTDLDIMVTTRSFEAVARMSPEVCVKRDPDARLYCGDDVVLDFPALGMDFQLDGIDIDIRSTGSASYHGHSYHLGLSPRALAHRLTLRVNGVTIYIANPFDTMAVKAIMQRGSEQQKFDLPDARALARNCNFEPRYVVRRAQEMNLDHRAWSFLCRAGFMVPELPTVKRLRQIPFYSTITSVIN